MPEIYLSDQNYEGKDFSIAPLERGEYEVCHFSHCNFSGVDLSGYKFIDCSFEDCNLSMAKLNKTVLNGIKFIGCKMPGLHFDTCQAFGLSFSFDNCQLNYSNFFGTKIPKTVFKNTNLLEVDFTESQLNGSIFDHCDLVRAVFENTNLEKSDFRTAIHYVIHPEKNRIKKARFSTDGLPGLLQQYDIDIAT
jgi:uncharacterized protein YjbI with pentapeptide repeats